MYINLFVDEAETALESYFKTLRGIASSAVTVKIESEPPPASAPVVKPELYGSAILDEIANAPKSDKIALIKKLREFASDNGVIMGLGFAKKLVELAPQFQNENMDSPPPAPPQ